MDYLAGGLTTKHITIMHGVALWQGMRQSFLRGYFQQHKDSERCSVRLWLIGRKIRGGLAVDWYPAKTQGPSTAHDLSKKLRDHASLGMTVHRGTAKSSAAVRNSDACSGFHDRRFRFWVIVNARMNWVRYRSHATYSRQPRQVRKEATVTGSCVCSEVPVPDFFPQVSFGSSRTSDYPLLHSFTTSFRRNRVFGPSI